MVSGLVNRSKSMGLTWPLTLPPVVVFVVLTGGSLLTAAMVGTESFFSPFRLFSYTVGSSPLPVLYPVLVVSVFLLGFTEQLRGRWIFYVRPRADLRKYLARAAALNASLAFAVFFLFVLVVGVVILFALPSAHASFAVVEPGTVISPDDKFARLSGLLPVSKLLYLGVYAAWQGANAAVWATVGFAAVLVIRNRMVALAVPFVIVVVLSVVMSFGPSWSVQNTPWLLWMLFSVGQEPMLPSYFVLAVFAVIATTLAGFAISRPNRWGTLR